jgi:Asp-tRNA(Asn)/Glu-tRNA(Gln) amidotransferase B subunit
MQSLKEKYELVIGLEVHIQLLTQSKAFAPEVNSYGDLPNTNVSVVTLAHPGVLPRANKTTFDYAIRLGLALGSQKLFLLVKTISTPICPKATKLPKTKLLSVQVAK